KLKLHRKGKKEIDPVTFEVVRHALWNVNEEHGATIQRLSGSPVAMYALDLNPSILTEDAEFVYFGPYMQYMSGVTDTQVKWTLENRSDNPGIAKAERRGARFPRPARRQHDRQGSRSCLDKKIWRRHGQGRNEEDPRRRRARVPEEIVFAARWHMARPHLCRVLPPRRPAGA